MTFYLVRAIVPCSSSPANSLILVRTFLLVLILEFFSTIVGFLATDVLRVGPYQAVGASPASGGC